MTVPEIFETVDLRKAALEVGVAGVNTYCEGFEATTDFFDFDDPKLSEIESYLRQNQWQKFDQVRVIGEGDQVKLAIVSGRDTRTQERFLFITPVDTDPEDFRLKMGELERTFSYLPGVNASATDCLASEGHNPGQIKISKENGKFLVEMIPGKVGSFSTSR